MPIHLDMVLGKMIWLEGKLFADHTSQNLPVFIYRNCSGKDNMFAVLYSTYKFYIYDILCYIYIADICSTCIKRQKRKYLFKELFASLSLKTTKDPTRGTHVAEKKRAVFRKNSKIRA